MKYRGLQSCLFLLFVVPALALPGLCYAANPTLSVPQTVNVPTPGLVIIKADTNCTWVGWHAEDPGIQVIPPYLLKNSLTCVAVVAANGTYHILAYAGDANGSAPEQICTITVGPPGPGPLPPPTPTDPLTQAIQTAYTADVLATKSAKKDKLQSLYLAGVSTALKRPDVLTLANLDSVMIQGRQSLGIADTELLAERQAIEAYLNTKITQPRNAPLDAATKTLVATEFTNVANALGAVK